MRPTEAQPATTPTGTPARTRSPLRNAMHNLGHLMAGRAVSGLLSLGATTLMARSLPPAQFGLVVLLHTYLLTWNGLFNCKPFEAIIRYGVAPLDAGDEPKLRRLVKLCLIVDVLTSLGAAAVAVATAGLIGRLLDWDADFIALARGYSLILLTGVTGTANGILRLFNRFDLIGRQLAIGPLLRFGGALIAWHFRLGINGFIAAWGAALLCEQLYMMLRGWRELRRQLKVPSLRGIRLADWRTEFPGIASFINVVYWQSNLDLLPKHVVTLAVGALLGPSAAGLFRIARELSTVLATPAALLRQVLFPDLTRLWQQGGSGIAWILLRTIGGAGAGGALVVAVAWIGGSALLGSLAGPDYAAAAPVLTWLLAAGTFDLCASVLRAAGYAMGNAGAVLRLNAVAAIVYALALVIATPVYGLHGAGMSACAASLLTLGGMILLVRARWREHTGRNA